ncbi:hypothetical protein FTO70_11410 [Methanosarcina sp. KYL-1]|uniref:hypothetical protein n=1 Tax=Methanosarcina sp. KYL-1 TaxID=2602068 RepID=UPI00210092E3|nr:hypothetical protein [Methanosarcina sp. KYL-1]MCQ1536275.1 hypothetical protein [Methanosarcina sp. KYL-1]
MEKVPEIFDFQIIIESEEIDELTDYWQKQCSILCGELRKSLISGSIEPLTSECESGEKAGIDTLFNILLASGITLKAFDRMFDVTKIWLEYRRSAKVVLKYEDGSTIELTHLSKSEAFELIKNHQQRPNE